MRDGEDPTPRGEGPVPSGGVPESGITRQNVSRRGLLKGVAAGAGLLGTGRALDNVVLGYGVVVGTNLREQDLGVLADRGFRPGRGSAIGGNGGTADSVTVRTGRYRVRLVEGGTTVAAFDSAGTDPGRARSIGAPHGLGEASAELARDLSEVAAGTHAFEFHGIDGFFERLRTAETRPYTAAALRRWPRSAAPGRVERFAGADPRDPEAVLEGLVSGFREHAHYDADRYVAGAIQDNVIMNAADLRAPFREPVDFEALLADDGGTGMFCYEFTHRSIEALHAVPAVDQGVPVIGARVHDARHKHVYTAVASVVRDEKANDLRVPMTFVDYTHSTMYDDAHARGLLGEGVEAYDDRHRATAIEWVPY